MAKKEYVKPVLTKNEPLVDITFATGALSGTGGSPGTLINKAMNPEGIDIGGGADYSGGGTVTAMGGTGLDGGGASIGTGGTELGTVTGSGTVVGTGTVIPGTGGAPGTIL